MDSKDLDERELNDEIALNKKTLEQSELFKQKGNEFFKKSMNDEALEYYFKSVTLNPTDEKSYANIGQVLINKSLYSEAKEYLKTAINIDEDYTKAYYRLGVVEKKLGNYDAALKHFAKVQKLEPDNKAAIAEYELISNFLSTRQKEAKSIKTNLSADIPLTKSSVDPTKSSVDQTKSSVGPIKSSVDPTKSSVDPTKSSVDPSQLANSEKQASKIANQRNNSKKISIEKLKIASSKIEPIQLPNTLPKTSYQFNLIWNEIKNDQTKFDYLEFIGAFHFLQLFQKNLEPDFLSELIALFNRMDDKKLAFNYLTVISKIDNFNFIISFLSNNEKELLKETIYSLDVDILNKNFLIKLYKI